MLLNFLIPKNYQDFEVLCYRLWKAEWKTSDIALYGRSGQDQDGIDIYGRPSGLSGYVGIQCKLRDVNVRNKFSIDNVRYEANKALKANLQIQTLIIATTAARDKAVQSELIKLNLASTYPFGIEVYFWDDISMMLSRHYQIAEEIRYGYDRLRVLDWHLDWSYTRVYKAKYETNCYLLQSISAGKLLCVHFESDSFSVCNDVPAAEFVNSFLPANERRFAVEDLLEPLYKLFRVLPIIGLSAGFKVRDKEFFYSVTVFTAGAGPVKFEGDAAGFSCLDDKGFYMPHFESDKNEALIKFQRAARDLCKITVSLPIVEAYRYYYL